MKSLKQLTYAVLAVFAGMNTVNAQYNREMTIQPYRSSMDEPSMTELSANESYLEGRYATPGSLSNQDPYMSSSRAYPTTIKQTKQQLPRYYPYNATASEPTKETVRLKDATITDRYTYPSNAADEYTYPNFEDQIVYPARSTSGNKTFTNGISYATTSEYSSPNTTDDETLNQEQTIRPASDYETSSSEVSSIGD